jgi:hypothetical protein
MRRLLLTGTLAVSLSALGASSAVARHHVRGDATPEGAQKAPLFGPGDFTAPCSTGGVPTPQTFGFVVLNTPGNETTVTGEVALKHAAPDATYEAVLFQGTAVVCSGSPVGELTTNEKGNGNLHFKAPREPATTTFIVHVGGGPPQAPEFFATPAVDLD